MENQEEEVIVTNEVEETEEETIDWKAKYEAEEGRRKRLETKLSKATTETKVTTPSTSGEFDYSQKAFLKASGISGDEMKLARDFMLNTGKSLDEVVENKYFMAELNETRELKKTQDATPMGSKRTGASSMDSVDYWLAKDEMPPAGNVALQREWVNAKMKKEQTKGKFYNS